MAIFFPKLQFIDNDTPYSERIALSAFEKALPDDFYIYHSFSFLEKKVGLKEGEADLVIFHHKFGLLVLEVKGGEISIENGQWMSENRIGKHYIKNPFDQARKAKHAILDKIKTKTDAYVNIGYGVCFPNSTLPISVSLPMNVVRESIIDCTLLLNPEKCLKAIEKLFKEWNQNLDKSIADLIQYHVLAPTFRLIPNPKLSIQETDEKFLQLTQEQYQLLDWLEEQKQVLIKGSAGTGKTLLLIEKARRLADQGFSVLVLCFNIRLSEYLKSIIKNSNLVYVDNFHGFCELAAQKLNVPFVAPEDNESAQVFYEEVAPDLLLTAIDSGKVPSFDAVLIDEGQDFSESWWVPITSIIKPNGWFYIFHDPKQNVFVREVHFPIVKNEYPLTQNCRNTLKITQWLQTVNNTAALPKQGLPIGESPIVQHWTNYEEQLGQVTKCLKELIVKGFSLSDMIILTPYRKEKSLLYSLLKDKMFTNLQIESIMKFKGLESPVVLVCDLGINNFAKRSDMLFTAASRAQQLLIIFCHKEYGL